MGDGTKTVVSNRKARFEYHIDERLEAGMELLGTEVKSLRAGKANLQEAFCQVKQGEMYLMQCHIAPYDFGNRMNHDPLRPRKLLLHRKEIDRFDKAAQQKGYTIVPMRLYFSNGRAKLEIGLGKGKKLYDKRADIAERESKRRLDRIQKGGHAE
ncbi:MAG: SsrA-binding protein SmpB [Rhodothermales bacterium]|nr:SsrA-binding protein SmpB [Rhodothermales bacterium]MBO6779865.1 SsrA-binding protein SmpB [Rhodothermales bacterium]